MLALFLAYFGGSSNKGLQILTILGNIQEIILQTSKFTSYMYFIVNYFLKKKLELLLVL